MTELTQLALVWIADVLIVLMPRFTRNWRL